MAIAAKAKKLKPESPRLLQCGAVTTRLQTWIAGQTVRNSDPVGRQIQRACQVGLHVSREAARIPGLQPHVFIEVETAPMVP